MAGNAASAVPAEWPSLTASRKRVTTVQRLAKKLLPEKTAAAMEAESRQWRVVCACGHDRSIWDLGGIRYKAAGNPRKLMKCPACSKRTWHRVSKPPPVK
jgi:hypothetical protein